MDYSKQMDLVLEHSVLGLSGGLLVPTLTAPPRVYPAMKNSNEYDTLAEHGAWTLSMGNRP